MLFSIGGGYKKRIFYYLVEREEVKINELLEREKTDLEFVAIKKVKSEAKKGIDFSFLREVKIL